MNVHSVATVRHYRWAVLLAAFYLLPGLLSRAEAQQLQQPPQQNPTLVWLTTPAAMNKALTQVAALEVELAAYLPGSAQYTDAYRRIVYYKAIYRGLHQGKPIPAAIEAALAPAATLGGLEEQAFTPKAVLQALQTESIALLTN